MIGMLTGTIALRNDPYLIIDVSGVGYKVFASAEVFQKAKHNSENITVYTYTHVREDALELFGFDNPNDLVLFEKMIAVSGVGCKTAMGIFGVGSRAEIMNAILKGDTMFFTAVPRLGKKNAQKLIIELKGKLDITDTEIGIGQGSEEIEQVVAALQTFGYSAKESYDAVRKTDGEGLPAGKAGESIEEKIKKALKYLGR